MIAAKSNFIYWICSQLRVSADNSSQKSAQILKRQLMQLAEGLKYPFVRDLSLNLVITSSLKLKIQDISWNKLNVSYQYRARRIR